MTRSWMTVRGTPRPYHQGLAREPRGTALHIDRHQYGTNFHDAVPEKAKSSTLGPNVYFPALCRAAPPRRDGGRILSTGGENVMQESERFDVAILGAGIGGTMLAAILARQGKKVLILEKGSHPRFAVGEALLPQSTLLMWILAHRFDVPETQHLPRPHPLPKHVAPTCGVKRALGFLYHEEGQRQDPLKSNLLIAPS